MSVFELSDESKDYDDAAAFNSAHFHFNTRYASQKLFDM